LFTVTAVKTSNPKQILYLGDHLVLTVDIKRGRGGEVLIDRTEIPFKLSTVNSKKARDGFIPFSCNRCRPEYHVSDPLTEYRCLKGKGDHVENVLQMLSLLIFSCYCKKVNLSP
jgi:hypothetical protein